jgi:hypothetical protein
MARPKTNKTSFTIFDWLNQITYEKKLWSEFTEDQQESFNSYMIHRFLSMYQGYIDITNIVQRFPMNDKETIYNTYRSMIPKKKMFLKYIKSTQKRTPDSLLIHIAEHFQCSLGEAEEYTYILRKTGIEQILFERGIGDKESEKLLKELVL